MSKEPKKIAVGSEKTPLDSLFHDCQLNRVSSVQFKFDGDGLFRRYQRLITGLAGLGYQYSRSGVDEGALAVFTPSTSLYPKVSVSLGAETLRVNLMR